MPEVARDLFAEITGDDTRGDEDLSSSRGSPYVRGDFPVAEVQCDESPFTAPDQSAGIDWTAAGTHIEVNLDGAHHMDPDGLISVDGNGDLVLEPGVWLIDLCPQLSNGSGTIEHARLAVTSADGTVVHKQTNDLGLVPSGGLAPHLPVVLRLDVSTAVAFRASQRTAGTDITIGNDSLVAITRRIGLAQERDS